MKKMCEKCTTSEAFFPAYPSRENREIIYLCGKCWLEDTLSMLFVPSTIDPTVVGVKVGTEQFIRYETYIDAFIASNSFIGNPNIKPELYMTLADKIADLMKDVISPAMSDEFTVEQTIAIVHLAGFMIWVKHIGKLKLAGGKDDNLPGVSLN